MKPAKEPWDSSSIETIWRLSFRWRTKNMARSAQELADRLGARVVGQIPEVGGGTFGAARLALIIEDLRSRLEPSRGKRSGRPTDAAWNRHPKVPMSANTERKLARLAKRASGDGRSISPMQMAAHLLEEVVTRISVE
jgi:hypothetical protein